MKTLGFELLFLIIFLAAVFVGLKATLDTDHPMNKKIIPVWEVSERLVALEAKVASLSLYMKAEKE